MLLNDKIENLKDEIDRLESTVEYLKNDEDYGLYDQILLKIDFYEERIACLKENLKRLENFGKYWREQQKENLGILKFLNSRL